MVGHGSLKMMFEIKSGVILIQVGEDNGGKGGEWCLGQHTNRACS